MFLLPSFSFIYLILFFFPFSVVIYGRIIDMGLAKNDFYVVSFVMRSLLTWT